MLSPSKLIRSALLACATVVTALTPAHATAPASVEQWGIFEVELKGPADGNPFIDVRFSAVFTNGEKSIEAAGFYDGDGIYRVRFMPDKQGSWSYQTVSNRWPLTKHYGTFTVTAPTAGNHGPVSVHNT
jgi:hypothetical protein